MSCREEAKKQAAAGKGKLTLSPAAAFCGFPFGSSGKSPLILRENIVYLKKKGFRNPRETGGREGIA